MTRYVDTIERDALERTDARRTGGWPEYGPVDAVLGLGLTYLVVDRATPAVVDVSRDVLPSVSSSAVQTALAAFLWFVVVVTVLDQGVRQVRAYAGEREETSLWRWVPSESEATVAVSSLVLGGVLAAWSYEVALATVPEAVRAVASLDWTILTSVEFVTLVVFLIAFNVATWGADRLVIGGVRSMRAE
jgi:hypothetical protein